MVLMTTDSTTPQPDPIVVAASELAMAIQEAMSEYLQNASTNVGSPTKERVEQQATQAFVALRDSIVRALRIASSEKSVG